MARATFQSAKHAIPTIDTRTLYQQMIDALVEGLTGNDDADAERKRLQDDFEFYAFNALKILPKQGALAPLIMNSAQEFLHNQVEQQRARQGYVRALVLKGRQQGISTYTEARFYWRVTSQVGARALIITHKGDASKNLFEMTKRYHDNCLECVKPATKANNGYELTFGDINGGFKIDTAGGEGVGRSATVRYFHGSEVAFWPNGEELLASALNCVPNGLYAGGTEIILESTSSGPSGVFYDYWQDAHAGVNGYMPIFIPWFWQYEYRLPVDADFSLKPEEQELVQQFGLEPRQIAWRRSKISELRGLQHFKREYPNTSAEAFEADVQGALWNSQLLDDNRVHEAPALSRVAVAIDPAGGTGDNNDETGIIVGGVTRGDGSGHGYVLEDGSLRGTPQQWAKAAIALYYKHKADYIVVERNFGGDMVKNTLAVIDSRIKIVEVTASRGKQARSEPVVTIDEEGRLHHVGYLPSLEDQMTTWVPGISTKSPDRVDARTWLFTELFGLYEQKVPTGTRTLQVDLRSRLGRR